MWETRLYVSLAELQAMSITQLHRMRLVARTTDAFTAFFDGTPIHAHGRVF